MKKRLKKICMTQKPYFRAGVLLCISRKKRENPVGLRSVLRQSVKRPTLPNDCIVRVDGYAFWEKKWKHSCERVAWRKGAIRAWLYLVAANLRQGKYIFVREGELGLKKNRKNPVASRARQLSNDCKLTRRRTLTLQVPTKALYQRAPRARVFLFPSDQRLRPVAVGSTAYLLSMVARVTYHWSRLFMLLTYRVYGQFRDRW